MQFSELNFSKKEGVSIWNILSFSAYSLLWWIALNFMQELLCASFGSLSQGRPDLKYFNLMYRPGIYNWLSDATSNLFIKRSTFLCRNTHKFIFIFSHFPFWFFWFFFWFFSLTSWGRKALVTTSAHLSLSSNFQTNFLSTFRSTAEF